MINLIKEKDPLIFVIIFNRIIWDNWYSTGTYGDKLKKFYLLPLFNYKY